MTKIIALVNEKGGVAKTTSAKNIAIGLALVGKKVLLIDTDPSANLTNVLGVEITEEKGSIYDAYMEFVNGEDAETNPLGKRCIYKQEEGIDIIPAGKNLAKVMQLLTTAAGQGLALKIFLDPIKDEYDYVFIDCPAGSNNIFTTNALFAADEIIIPMQAHKMSVDALLELIKAVANIKKIKKLNNLGATPNVLGAIFTTVRCETNNDRLIMDWLRSEYKDLHFFNTIIPQSTKIPESDAALQSIHKYAPYSNVSIYYKDLVNEILEIEERDKA